MTEKEIMEAAKKAKMNKRKIYIAGGCLTDGEQWQRDQDKALCEKYGHVYYNPKDNKEINDKVNAIQEGLAERIVQHDTDAIIWSDTVLIEPLPHFTGTCVEIGQVKGMRDVATFIRDMIETGHTLEDIHYECTRHIEREVLPYTTDIRAKNMSEQSGFRREYTPHAYVYGVCLDLTDGKGFYDRSEIEEILNNG